MNDYEKMSKIAGKASGVSFALIILGCMIPVIVICVGTLLTQ